MTPADWRDLLWALEHAVPHVRDKVTAAEAKAAMEAQAKVDAGIILPVRDMGGDPHELVDADAYVVARCRGDDFAATVAQALNIAGPALRLAREIAAINPGHGALEYVMVQLQDLAKPIVAAADAAGVLLPGESDGR